jgi:hypothetical protein
VLLYTRAGLASSQMDDHHGHVIDGTARAHQWRRSRFQAAREDEDDQAARSDAPKSIAGSLLVPADMLGKTGPLEHQDDYGARQEDTEPSRGAIAQPQTGAASADLLVHQNPSRPRCVSCWSIEASWIDLKALVWRMRSRVIAPNTAMPTMIGTRAVVSAADPI